jgi:hypothetical protein
MEDTLPKEKRRWTGLLAKITFCVLALGLVMLTVLANMGGNTEEHKLSIEQFIGEASGYEARVKKLNRMTYFPSITVDFEDLELFEKGKPERAAVHVDRALMSISFWDVMLQNGHFKQLNVQGFQTRPGVFINKKIVLKYFAAVDAQDGPRLEGQGTIGDVPLNVGMGLISYGNAKNKKYTFDAERDVNIHLGDVKLDAHVSNATNPAITLRDFKIAQGGKDIVTGEITLSNRRTSEVIMGGALHVGQTVLKPDLVFDRKEGKVSGVIAAENFNEKDFAEGSGFDGLVDILVQYLGNPERDGKRLDIFFAGQDIMLDVNGEKKKLRFENNTLSFK